MFGLGVGKAEIQLEKMNFSPGETINGKLVFNLKKATKAKGVKVLLCAEQNFQEMDSRGRINTVTRRIYEFPLKLDVEKEYAATGSQPLSYAFQLKVPETAGSSGASQPSGLKISLGPITLGGGNGPVGPVRWFIEGDLDIPMAFDVKARVQINV